MGIKPYGAEGAGFSIVGRGDSVFFIGNPQGREQCLVGFRFSEDGKQVTCEEIVRSEGKSSGHTPVLFGDHLYRFTASRREGKDVIAIADGSAVARLYAPTGGTSPILAGKHFFTYASTGRNRVDYRLVHPVSVVELAGPTQQGAVTTNFLDLSAPPPDWRIEKYLPEVYTEIAANKPLPIWPLKKWSTPFWGKDGGIPDGTGVGGFCASGNRVVLRTLGTLYCIGDPSKKYDWDSASRP